MKLVFLSFGALASAASLATTTRYYDGQEGACGCGTSSGADAWQLGISDNVYTAAGSQALFDTSGSSWCGAGCGTCYNLTSTGSSACDGCGTGGVAGDSIIVMVTNLCPYNGNQQWCPQPGSTNEYGYGYHFDINAESEVFGDNVVVQFEQVTCPGQATTDWETCLCYDQTSTDTTSASLASATSASPQGESESSTTSTEPTVTAPNSAAETTVVVTSATPTSTPSSCTGDATPSDTSASTGSTQTLYGQCGGANWTGATACESGSTCKVQNPYYSQCVSSSD
ncbi:uncharacterized protein TRUGW13939_01356 [Talaromyces rugulosus]|uniref:Cellulase n=1 Tax=Talaromyces rugulosus TaxID=121627 RepID=A0A7H8QL90_TALRU|nr:uncharacterized protein TRUGW13939_01356 [Talaromyces rugulosus]QKX54271.1 hypothetical protein TRUGW13939_01356 [Talaromyces rugulosus]